MIRCRYCQKAIGAPTVTVGDPQRTAHDLVQVLLKHIIEQHRKEDLELQQQAIQFLGCLRLKQFRDIDNKEVEQSLTSGLAHIRSLTDDGPLPRNHYASIARAACDIMTNNTVTGEQRVAALDALLYQAYEEGRGSKPTQPLTVSQSN